MCFMLIFPVNASFILMSFSLIFVLNLKALMNRIVSILADSIANVFPIQARGPCKWKIDEKPIENRSQLTAPNGKKQ
jgi:hypothetical protein